MEDWLKCQISLLVKYRQNQRSSLTIRRTFYSIRKKKIIFYALLKSRLPKYVFNATGFIWHSKIILCIALQWDSWKAVGVSKQIYIIFYTFWWYMRPISQHLIDRRKRNILADQLKRRYRESIQNYIMGIKRLSIDTSITGLPNMHNLWSI